MKWLAGIFMVAILALFCALLFSPAFACAHDGVETHRIETPPKTPLENHRDMHQQHTEHLIDHEHENPHTLPSHGDCPDSCPKNCGGAMGCKGCTSMASILINASTVNRSPMPYLAIADVTSFIDIAFAQLEPPPPKFLL